MLISNISLFLKYFICIDAIALDYRSILIIQCDENAWLLDAANSGVP